MSLPTLAFVRPQATFDVIIIAPWVLAVSIGENLLIAASKQKKCSTNYSGPKRKGWRAIKFSRCPPLFLVAICFSCKAMILSLKSSGTLLPFSNQSATTRMCECTECQKHSVHAKRHSARAVRVQHSGQNTRQMFLRNIFQLHSVQTIHSAKKICAECFRNLGQNHTQYKSERTPTTLYCTNT